MKVRWSNVVMPLLFISTILLYSSSIFFPFAMVDDKDYLTGNNMVLNGLSLDSIRWAFTAIYAANWHPVTWLSLMTDVTLFGTGPMGFHAVNVLFHALCTCLLFLLFRSMTGALWRSAFVAACFALHPLHVESVAWITERKDVLSSLFWVLTLLCYAGYATSGKRSRYLGALALFAVGLMTKPMLVTVPLVMLMLDFWPLERLGDASNNRSMDRLRGESTRLSALLIEKLPFVALAALSSLITLYAQKAGGAVIKLVDLPLVPRLENAAWAYVRYLGKCFYPTKLAIFYPWDGVSLWQVGGALLILGGVSVAAFRLRRGHPYLLVGWLWFLITLLPVIGIIQVGEQSIADRYTYIPFIGLFVMLAWGGEYLRGTGLPGLRKAIPFAAGGTLVALTALTWTQLGYWQDNALLVGHGLEVTGDNPFLHSVLGRVYQQKGRDDLALAQYQEALRLEPEQPEIYFDMGGTLQRLGDVDRSLLAFERAVQLQPDIPKYRNNLGALLAQKGRFAEAAQHFSQALKLEPNEKTRNNLELALQRLNGK